ncbi:hypothetical protein AAMO2058_000179200 [Amorphochlora amoebiformis]
MVTLVTIETSLSGNRFPRLTVRSEPHHPSILPLRKLLLDGLDSLASRPIVASDDDGEFYVHFLRNRESREHFPEALNDALDFHLWDRLGIAFVLCELRLEVPTGGFRS